MISDLPRAALVGEVDRNVGNRPKIKHGIYDVVNQCINAYGYCWSWNSVRKRGPISYDFSKLFYNGNIVM